MKKLFYSNNYYQIKVIGLGDTGSSVKTLHVLASNYLEAVRMSRTVLDFDYKCFQEFLAKYRFLKLALMNMYPLQGWEITRCHIEGCLRVFQKDNRLNEDVAVLIQVESNRVVANYVRNKSR